MSGSRRTTSLLVALLALAPAGAARAQTAFGPEDTKETYYWVSQEATLPLFVRTDYAGMRAIAAQLGVRVRVAGPATADLQQLVATLDEVCAQRPAGVSVVGWDPALAASVDRCVEMRVPVVVDDADLPGSKRLAFVGTDWRGIGRAQAEAVMRALPKGGTVATLSIRNADNMKAAVEGFAGALEPKWRVIANEDDTGDAAVAARVASAIIAANPGIGALCGFDSESGPGIVQAVTEGGLQGRIVVTAMEQTPEFLKTLRDGTTTAIVVQNRELFTYYAFRLLYDFNHNGLTTGGLSGWRGRPIPAVIDTGLLVVTKDNVGPMLEAAARE